MWKCMLNALEALSYVAVIGAVGIAWYEYRSQVERSARERSLDLVMRFQDDKLSEARRSILKPWLNYNLDKFSKSDVARDVVDELVIKVVEKNKNIDQSKDVMISIIMITDFMDTVYSCAESRVCDESVIDKFIGNFAYSFYCLYNPVIRNVKHEANFYLHGNGLEKLALKHGACP